MHTGEATLTARAPRRNSILLPAAQAVSSFGDSALWLAAGLWVHQSTGSDSAAALTFFFYLLAALTAPWLGAFVDQIGKRPAIIVGNICGIFCLTPLFLVPPGSAGLIVVYGVVFANGIVANFLNPAYSALAVEAVDKEQLPTVNSGLRVSQTALRVIAPPVGAIIFVRLGLRASVSLDILTFLLAIVVIFAVATSRQPNDGPRLRPKFPSYIQSVQTALSVRALRVIAIPTLVFASCMGAGEAIMWEVVTTGVGQPASFISVMQMATAIGGVLLGLVAAACIRRLGSDRSFALGLCIFAIGLVSQAFPSVPLALVGSAAVGGGTSILFVAAMTALQQGADSKTLGQAFAGFELISTLPQTVFVAGGSYAILYLDFRATLCGASALCIVTALILYRKTRPNPAHLDGSDETCQTHMDLC